MGTILDFRLPTSRKPAKSLPPSETRAPAQILFFSGVRYSRPDDEINRPAGNSSRRRRKRRNG